MQKTLLLLLLLMCIYINIHAQKTIAPKQSNNIYLNHAGDVAMALQRIQTRQNHLWQKAGWWNSANVMEAMIDYGQNSGTNLSANCRQIFKANKYFALGGFKNQSFDDCAWWALAWLKAYDQYNDVRYLKTAQHIFAFMLTQGWDNKCNGGMAWQQLNRYKNAITNELFILLAARLAAGQTDPVKKNYYQTWALRGWAWLNQSGMLNANHLFNDGLDKNCNNNHGQTWTYNQGVILAALKEIYVFTADTNYLQLAHKIALASMQNLSDANGILTEAGDGKLGHDGSQFKGIYIKFLAELNTVLKDPAIKQYIIHNADVAWAHAQNNEHLFDPVWQGQFENWQGSSTGVALDLMNAATIEAKQ